MHIYHGTVYLTNVVVFFCPYHFEFLYSTSPQTMVYQDDTFEYEADTNMIDFFDR